MLYLYCIVVREQHLEVEVHVRVCVCICVCVCVCVCWGVVESMAAQVATEIVLVQHPVRCASMATIWKG